MNPYEELLAKLIRFEVRYVLVGGAAVLMQGYPRHTNDLDIILEASEENAQRFLAALATWGEGSGSSLSVEEFAVPQTGAVRIVEDFPLDVFTLMRARALQIDLSYADLSSDALTYDLGDGVKVPYASISRLLDLKAGTGRPKDHLDVVVLTEISRGLREKKPADFTVMESDPTTGMSLDQGEWPLSSGDDAKPNF